MRSLVAAIAALVSLPAAAALPLGSVGLLAPQLGIAVGIPVLVVAGIAVALPAVGVVGGVMLANRKKRKHSNAKRR